MPRRYSGWVVLLLTAALLAGTPGTQQFPRLQEENLDGQQVVLPDAASGKVAVLVLGFSRSSQKPSEAWSKRLFDDFAKNPAFVLYQLPVIEAAPRFVRGMITSGMKKGTPENLRPFFVPVVHNEDQLKNFVGYQDEDDAYIVVLDRSGKLVYQTHGLTPDQGYPALHAQVQALLQ